MFRVFAGVVLCTSIAMAQTTRFVINVVDENGVHITDAQVQLRGPAALGCTTSAAGRCAVAAPAGSYEVIASKRGFYQSIVYNVEPQTTPILQVALAHTQEVKESVEVQASPPAIDAQQVAQTSTLGSTEIVNVPFPVTRDIRYALPYIPGVVRDRSGQIHVAGAETYQTLTLLDGFDVADPATGLLNTRFSTDAIRAIDIESGRYSAQYGPSSGGVAAFTTMSGDDKFRFSATNFVPSVQMKQGLHFDKVTPRATFSGPIMKGRAWFLLAPDGEYDNNIVSGLPAGQNSNPVWRVSNLAKVQVNLTPKNIFTTSLLVNDLHSSYGGVSPFTPIETTLIEAHSMYMGTFRDQMYVGGAMIEAALAISRYHDRALPLGSAPYVISPGIAHGNYYRSQWIGSGRLEPQLNIYLPRYHWMGAHEIRFGGVARDVSETNTTIRTPISILRGDGTLYSRIVFSNPGAWTQVNTVYGAYVEDRWSPAERWLIEAGTRVDRDTATASTSISPRIAATYMVNPETKLSLGVGLFHDYPTLDMLGQSLAGTRTQFIYDASGTILFGIPQVTSFGIPSGRLHASNARNWSIGLDHEFGRGLFLSLDYLDRRTTGDFAYQYAAATPQQNVFVIGNSRTTRYRAAQITAHQVFGDSYEWMLSYTHSLAHTNQALSYTLDEPVFSAQSPGPLPWDVPNKIISWAFLPVPHFKKWSFGYSAEWHTGYPYSVFNGLQQLVGPAGSRRFPNYLAINPFLERRITIKSYNLALRAGFENVTGSKNPLVVQNNIAGANFGTFAYTSSRALTARIRFLGRK